MFSILNRTFGPASGFEGETKPHQKGCLILVLKKQTNNKHKMLQLCHVLVVKHRF
jgi:hypothetical protein